MGTIETLAASDKWLLGVVSELHCSDRIFGETGQMLLADKVLPLMRMLADARCWKVANKHGGKIRVAFDVLNTGRWLTMPLTPSS